MIEFLNNVSPILLAFIATLFTYSVTAIGAALVFIFKKINKNVMDAMLGFAAGVMIAASYFSLLSPARDMAESLNMNVTLVLFISFFSGGLLLYIGDKLFNLFDKKLSKKTNKENKNNSFKRCLMLITSITLHNIPEGLCSWCRLWLNNIWSRWSHFIISPIISPRNRSPKLSRRNRC